MQTKEICYLADNALTALIDQLASFDQGQLNLEPFKGSWTAGQVGEHMIMANSRFVEMINGAVADTERAPDQFVAQIRDDFSNYHIKMHAPDFVKPALTSYNKEYLIHSLNYIRTDLKRAITTLDLNMTCTSFAIPVMGYITRLEAVTFVIYHTKRHVHQLKNIQFSILNMQ
ncbi:DinB family protein [Chitinophaga tropicalis]|uniref:DinB family protein n=1 Tax=Chitinophaga tropicalis TaxID=2683588 RepID=A0A7K1U5T3_9BACT|nr:DinB family protein [Chitinophaga tropicalis]MVT09699.1 DinB family protein [Chitinophaga tropicalis]